MNNKRQNTNKKFNLDHNCSGELCSCNNNFVTNAYKPPSGIVTLFSTRDNENTYELKYYVSKCELVLIITSICNPSTVESIVISNNTKSLPYGCAPITPCNPCKPITTCKPTMDFYTKCNKCEKGQKGDKGDQGQKGDQGSGSKGDKGDQGQKGDQGSGSKGDHGQKGDTGEKGCRGRKGDKGSKGDTGEKGSRGQKGDDGEKGDKGKHGIGFRYLCLYDPCKIYCYNDVVRVDRNHCSPGAIYVYTNSTPVGPLPDNTDINDVPGWKLMLKDATCDDLQYQSLCHKSCSCDKCDKYKTSDTSETGISECIDSSIKKIIDHHKKFNEISKDKYSFDHEKVRPLYFKGEWSKNESYDINDLIKYKNIFYIAIKKSCGVTPTNKSMFWTVFFNGCIRHQGTWKKDKNYCINDIVRSETASFIAVDLPPKGCPTSDTNYWALMCKDGDENTCSFNNGRNIIESYNQNGLDCDFGLESFSSIETQPINSRLISYNYDSEICDFDDTDVQLKKLLNCTDSEYTIKDNNFYYACKQCDTRYPLNSKKPKWSVPISFEKTLDTGPAYDNKKGQIVFNRPGTYKVTVHITYKGTNIYKTAAYLLKPSDDVGANNYQKDRKISSSKMSIISSSQIKNHLHYCFVIKVKDALSTLVMISEHQENKIKHINDDKEITIFGKEKSWILIEKID